MSALDVNSGTERHHNFDNSASAKMLNRGCQSLAGGDSSTMRVLPYHLPLVAKRGLGSRLWDIDGNEYIDLNMAYGPLIFGHCDPKIVTAVTQQISEFGSQLGFPTQITIEAAEKIKQLFPSMELLRFANSGTEACASAIRLARTATRRRKLIVFEGHYHGWSEAVFNRYHAPLDALPKRGFGNAIPGTMGMSNSLDDVVVCQWNDIDTFERCIQEHGSDVAGVMMEPIMGNASLLGPREGFLQTVRELTIDRGCLLIFDEVITGLRASSGGAQERYLVTPDITVVSKSIGGGYPVAAFGASREIMQAVVSGEMFHGGVFSGNATVMAAANAVLTRVIAEKDVMYPQLERITGVLATGLHEIFTRLGVPHQMNQIGSLLGIILTHGDVPSISNYREIRQHGDFDRYRKFQQYMQQEGVYFHPNMFEAMFISTAHTEEDIAIVLERMEAGAVRCLVS
jgi:glutamate-1-semialdehyde 2,1-aminomutase